MRWRIRENVKRLTPYSPGKPIEEVRREFGLTRIAKLASNENPLGPSPKAVEALKAAAGDVHRYPDMAAAELKEAISRRFDLPPTQIVLGNGSDEIIHNLSQVFLAPGCSVVTGRPSFIQYAAAAHLAGAELIEVDLDAGARHDLSAMLKAAGENTRIVWIANPNNPTGTIVEREPLERFIQALPEGAVTVLDEAYYEFAAHEPNYPNSIDLIRSGYPVVGLRTFSKSYGLAGLRVGYGFMPPEIADAIDSVREPFNVNRPAQAAAVAALDDEEHLQRTLKHNDRALRRITGLLQRFGAATTESYANFVWADFGFDTQPLFDALLRRGVIIRTGAIFGRPTSVRISAGTDEDLDLLEEAFEDAMKEAAAI
ncbi:MAG: histidinol-phosphate transaminase [Armatimonadetes bacterium]|nr:histidinol-phosphate transaminase [Armatimonadota bacterium]